MFKRLEVVSGPIHAGKAVCFSQGEAAIIGPNGCGKSLLAEYLAFSLFGTVALRGKASDYKDLSVITKVIIKDKTYEIKRDTKNCIITDENGDIICQGTKPCNLKIIALLGYGYDVYKMGNYAEQLDILGLGKMKPAERKTALDKTLGIGVIDKLIKYANDESLRYKHESEAIKSINTHPGDEPVKPEGYDDPSILSKKYHEKENEIKAYRSFEKMVEPVKPSKPVWTSTFMEGTKSKDVLEGVKKRIEAETKLLNLENVKKPSYSREELEAMIKQQEGYDKYQNYLSQINMFKLDEDIKYTQKDAEALLVQIEAWEDYDKEYSHYLLGEVKCPNCEEKFNPYIDHIPFKPCFPRPAVTKDYLKKQLQLLEKKKILDSIEVVEEVKKPDRTPQECNFMLSMWDTYENNQKALPELKKQLEELKDYTSDNLNAIQAYEVNLAAYEKDIGTYMSIKTEYDRLVALYKDFDVQKEETELNQLAATYHKSNEYDNNKRFYDSKLEEYNRTKQKIEELEVQEQRYKKASENLKEMKVKIKGYVLPSLQKVASKLLSEMSDGQFQDVKIDPDFNILVEGREVNLFSGSEQAMINLALRLGLGQVLTHKAFSVFIGDEIDASMRDERAQLTADCLRKISKYIKQIILISHRDIEADYYIYLGEN